MPGKPPSAKQLLGSLPKHTSFFRGVVKADESDDTHVLFAREGDLSRWASVPVAAIDRLDLNGHPAQGGHHVVLHLNPPVSPLEKAYASLASLHVSPTPSGMRANAIGPDPSLCYDVATGQYFPCDKLAAS